MSKFIKSKAILTALLLTFIAVLGSGCGNSTDNNSGFVFTGDQGNGTTTGNLVFRFLNPQATTAPTGTTTLRFDLYDGDNGGGTLVFTHTALFASSVTLTEVPNTVRSVVITAFDANNFPIGTLVNNNGVTPGETTEVDLSGATFTLVTISGLVASPNPLNLDIGGTGTYTIVATFTNSAVTSIPSGDVNYTINAPSLANVSSSGLFTGLNFGNTTVDITYTFNGSQSSTSAGLFVNNTPR